MTRTIVLGVERAAVEAACEPSERAEVLGEALRAGARVCLSLAQVRLLHEFLVEWAEGRPSIERAAVLAQGPMLVKYVGAALLQSRSLDAIDREGVGRVVVVGLAERDREVVRQWATSLGLEFGVRAAARESREGSWRKRYADFVEKGKLVRAVFRRSPRLDAPSLVVVSLQRNSTRAILAALRASNRNLKAHFLGTAADEESALLVAAAGYTFSPFERGLTPRMVLTMRRRGKRLLGLAGREKLARVLGEMDFPSWLDRPSLAAWLFARWETTLGKVLSLAEIVDRSLEELRPRGCLFLTHRAMMNEILAVRRHQLARIFLLQGIVPEDPPVFTALDVDAAIVGSRLDLPYLERCGVAPARTHVTGYPDYEHFDLLRKETCRRELEAVFPSSSGRPLVVFTSQYATELFPDSARMKNLEAFVEAALLLPEAFFLIKAHPRLETLPADFVARLPENVALCPPFDTPTAMKAADVVATYWSTTALEAIILDVPLVQLNVTGLPDFFPIVPSLGRSMARSGEELAASLRSFFGDTDAAREDATRRASYRRSFQLDANAGASARAARIIEDCLGRSGFRAAGSEGGDPPRIDPR